MFGRVRAAPTSPDFLDRPPPKILNHRPLSIYEATLLKLKLGSRHSDLRSNSDEAMEEEKNSDSTSVSDSSGHDSCSPLVEGVKMEANHIFANNLNDSSDITVSLFEEAMSIDTVCSSASISPNSSSCQSSEPQTKRDVSVLYLFSKFKNSHQASSESSCGDKAMVIESGHSSTSSLPTSGNCLSFDSITSKEAKTEEEYYISSLPVCQI